MPLADKPVLSNLLEERKYHLGITGTGAAEATKRFGDNIAIARQGVGVHRISFPTHPGALKGIRWSFRAVTPSAVKGYTLTAGDYVPASGNTPGYVEISIWNSAFAAADLAAAQYLEVEFIFAQMGG